MDVDIFSRVPVIPVLTIHRTEDAEPVARALAEGGLNVIEVTLRTPCAEAAIERMARLDSTSRPVLVGAGTVLDAAQAKRACDSGARFLVSPGDAPGVGEVARAAGVPYLPGCVTATEVLRAAANGLRVLKFFPAEAAGGTRVLAALAAPLPDITFCPTGGIGASNARDYLRLPNVCCVGGSWPATEAAIAQADWVGIRERAREAARLREETVDT